MSDFDAHYSIYDEANQILVDAAPYIYFYNAENALAHWSHVMGYTLRADRLNRFKNTWLVSN